MSTKDDGGPAFPRQPIYHRPDGSSLIEEQGGMTLRDYFAAKAMQALLLHGSLQDFLTDDTDKNSEGFVSDMSYCVADAMLAARSES